MLMQRTLLAGAVLLAMVGLTLLSATGATADEDAKSVSGKAFPSTVLLVLEDADRQPISLGSGFIVKDGVVATNWHVVEGAHSGMVKVIGTERGHEITGVVGSDRKRDLALLRVEGLEAPVLPLGDSDKVVVGDTVFAIGNPRGLEGTLSKGIVSGLRTVEDCRLVQMTASISPGSSGGPVLDMQGAVVGVAASTVRDGQNLNFAIPVNYVKPLIEGIDSPVPLSASQGAEDGESILGKLGRETRTLVTTSGFVWSEDVLVPRLPSSFTFSVRNGLREPIRNVVCLVIFRDAEKQPLETVTLVCQGPVRAGLAKRVEGEVESNVKKLTTRSESGYFTDAPRDGQLEIRVLDFEKLE